MLSNCILSKFIGKVPVPGTDGLNGHQSLPLPTAEEL